MINQALLNDVIAYADRAHGDQLRRYAGDRYIVHPIRVMETCGKYTEDVTILAAAVLHDVLEDTPVSSEELSIWLNSLMSAESASRTCKMVIELTDVYTTENYPAWNRHKRKRKEEDRMAMISADAQTIKYADILDNAPEIAVHDPDFANRYLQECKALLKRMKSGNQELRQRSLDAVNQWLQHQ